MTPGVPAGVTTVVLAGRGAVDDPALLRAFEAAGGQARVVRRCADLVELLACAPTTAVDVAVVAATVRRLDRDAVATVRAHGVRVVVVCDARADVAAWDRCGADSVVLGDDPATVVAAVLALGPGPGTTRGAPVPDRSLQVEGSGGLSTLPDRPGVAAAPVTSGAAAHGRVVAVWGPTGAPGRTTVALGLADELARAGRSTLLVDADTYGAAVGLHLGLLDDTSGLAATTRLAALGRLDESALRRAAVGLGSGLSVLTGLARPSRWPELREASVQAVLDLAAQCWSCVVVDVGFGLGAGITTGSGLGPPDRDDTTRAVLAMCDTLVAVASGDAVGLVRLARELDTAADLAPTARRLVVVNRTRRSSLGPRPQRQAAEVLGAAVPAGGLVTLPDDAGACDAALLQGRTLAEVAPDSRLREALRSLSTVVEPAATPSRTRRRATRRANGPRRVLRRAG
jgi:Flp pilus assembly CpaE family ATPase